MRTLSGSGGTWTSMVLTDPGNNGSGSFTATSYKLEVLVTDLAGRTTSATRNFTVTGF